jgi:Carboxypeptidase regulatory-like domain/TonB-dependent Receptor Plug Domain
MYKLRFLLGSVSLLLAATFALAQTGSIQGTVTDSAGAVVRGAEVTVRDLGSNALRTVTSNGTGNYSVPSLAPGLYEITVKMASFKTFHAPDVKLSVAQVLPLDVALEPGAVTEEVQVRADQIPDVDLETAQVSNLVDAEKIKELPLITRDPYQLVLLAPGTSQTDSSHGGFSVNGARDRNNNFLLDGVDNNDTSVPGGAAGGVLAANPDSAEEFRVITDSFNAEFGRNNGAIIDVVTKSGTNVFHGGVYEFGRWNGFGGARDYFNPASQGPMNPYVRNQFGGSIGGPIIKNKTFFFFNQEIDRFRTTLTNTATVPTAAFKTGVFTYTRSDGSQVPVDLTPADTQGDNPFGIPLDPTMQKVFSLYPNPTVSNGDGFSGTLFFPSSSASNLYNSTAKIDHHFTDRETFSARYGYDHFNDPDPGHNAILPGGVGSVQEKSIGEGLSAQLTSTLNGNLLNNFQFGWNHIYATFNCTGLNVLDSPGGIDQFGNGRDYGMSPFTSFGCNALAADNQNRKTGTVSYSDAISWVHGAHTWKFGFDFRDVGENGPDNFNTRRQVTTDAAFLFGINLDNIPGGTEPVQDAALALWGYVIQDVQAQFFDKNQVRQATNGKFFRQHEFDWFGQDTWKARRNLTLTLGLRYQLNGVPYEENGNASNLLTNPAASPTVFTIVGPGTGQSMYQPDYSNVEPRVGFSWDPWSDGKTSVRGAFGIFHDRIFGNLFGNIKGLPPFEQDYINFPQDTISNFLFNSDFFPAVPPQQTPSATVPNGTGLPNTTILSPHLRNPVANNWNFGIQRELPGNNTLDITYVGSMGVHVWSHTDGNPPVPGLVNQLVQFCSNPANTFDNQFTEAFLGGPGHCVPSDVQSGNLYQGLEFAALPFDAVTNNALLQPAYQQTIFNSIYHGLQTKFTHRLSHGLQLQGAYTYSHAIDNSVDPLGPAVGAHTFPRNSLDLAESRGNSDNDTRHVGVVSYVWEMPLGKGRAYMNTGVLGRVFEGFQLSGITTLQTGHPFQVRSALDSQRTGVPAWGLQVGDPFGAPSSPACTPNPTLGKVYMTNNCAFVEPPFGSAGSGRNEFYGPGFWNFDVVLSKRMKLSERFELETRFEGYNVFNHPHFLNPGTDAAGVGNLIESSQFGITNATFTQPDGTTSARQIQVAMKLNF